MSVCLSAAMMGENCATLHHTTRVRTGYGILDVDNLDVGVIWCCYYCWQD